MRYTLRFWLTLLFVLVILTAIIVLSVKLVSSLALTVETSSSNRVSEQARALAEQLSPSFERVAFDPRQQQIVEQFAKGFDDDVWIYAGNGGLRFVTQRFTSPGALLADARDAALAGKNYRAADISSDNPIVLGSTPIIIDGRLRGAVVVANNGAAARAIIDETRTRLGLAFALALAVAGLLGFFFSEIITLQVAHLKKGAHAMAEGDFDVRLKGLVPDEIGELASSFNMMAEKMSNVFRTLKEQQQEMSTVVETMGEGLVALKADGSLRLANSAAYDLIGPSLWRLSSKPVEDAFEGHKLVGPIKEALQCKNVTETAEVGDKVLLMHATPNDGPPGQPCDGAVLIFRDVTRQTKLERAQRDFISNASHELRTPISALKGFLELLAEGASEDEAVRDRFFKTMEMEIQRLERLVDELFTLSQLDSEQIYLKLSRCEAGEIVHNVATIAATLSEGSDIRIQTRIDPSAPLVWCDRDRIVQVLLGFVDNALKHSVTGSEVVLFAAKEHAGVRIGVSDTGEGIPPGEINKIFERFYRLSAKSETDTRGAGLGLSIAKEIVEAHGSNIRVESLPEEGSTFSFVLRPAEEA